MGKYELRMQDINLTKDDMENIKQGCLTTDQVESDLASVAKQRAFEVYVIQLLTQFKYSNKMEMNSTRREA